MQNAGLVRGRLRIRVATGEAGFSLMEVLVAMGVLAVGVLSFAALQVRAVQASSDAYARTQAMAIAQDLAERIRANNSQTSLYANSLTPSTASTLITTPFNPDCVTNSCSAGIANPAGTAANMVAYDVQSVRYNAQTLLSQGQVSMVACPSVTNGLNCILVSWDGLPPTGGTGGKCIDAMGLYVPPASTSNSPVTTCVMLEVM